MQSVSQRSKVSRIALWGCSSIVIVNVYFGQIMSPHPYDQLSQRSEVSRGALWGCSLSIFVFVIVFLLVRSCLLIFLIKCFKVHKSLGSLFEGVLNVFLIVFVIVIVIVIVIVFVIVFLVFRSCLIITLITCLNGHKSVRVLCGSIFQQCLVVIVTRSPIELSGDS